jgi:Tol biopolymer transport system component
VRRLFVALAAVGLVLAGAAALAAAARAVPVADYAGKASPDGRRLTFTRSYPFQSDRYAPKWRLALWVMDSEGRHQLQLLEPEVTGSGRFHWWTQTNLVAIPTAGGTVYRRPSDGAIVDTSPTDTGTLSPDGVWSYSEENGMLSIARADGSERRAVATAPGGYFGGATWSPDSSQLAYTVALGGNRKALEIVNVDGSDRRRLFVARAGFPVSWAPDGRRLAFSGQSGGRTFQWPHVYVAAADGSSVRRLVRGDASVPEWSPRGDWIVYARGFHSHSRDTYQIALSRPDGTATHAVLTVDENVSATWLEGGTKLAFTMRGTCRRNGVYTIGVDGKHLRRLTNRC